MSNSTLEIISIIINPENIEVRYKIKGEIEEKVTYIKKEKTTLRDSIITPLIEEIKNIINAL